jgi:SAM-dependent methyltransferase
MAGKFGPAVKGTLESLSLSAQNADGVFCECALNLSSDRLGSLSEIYKVLKPGGHFVLADIFTLGLDPKNPPPPQNTAPSCVGGAVTLTEARWQIESLGFEIKLTEDYAPALNALAAKLVWTYGQRGLAFLPTPKRDCAVGEKPPKLTYALLISQKPEGPFCP